MRRRYLILLVLAACTWLSWLFRYDMAGDGLVVLDRWTGTVIRPVAGDNFSLRDTEPR